MLFFFKLPLFILLFLFQASEALSFSLTWTNPPRFPSGTITVKVNTTSCSVGGVSESYTELQSLLQEAVDNYWNQIYTTSLHFKIEGTITVSNSDTALQNAANNFIAVGCHDMGNSSSSYAAASLACNTLNGECINAKGYMYINENANSPWASAERDIKIAILAHEIGHAIGIGHSEKSYALMYYATNNSDIQTYLSEDDADAATFLYPDDPALLGLGGNCGAVASTSGPLGHKKGPLYALSPFLSLFLGAFLILCIRRSFSFFRREAP